MQWARCKYGAVRRASVDWRHNKRRLHHEQRALYLGLREIIHGHDGCCNNTRTTHTHSNHRSAKFAGRRCHHKSINRSKWLDIRRFWRPWTNHTTTINIHTTPTTINIRRWHELPCAATTIRWHEYGYNNSSIIDSEKTATRKIASRRRWPPEQKTKTANDRWHQHHQNAKRCYEHTRNRQKTTQRARNIVRRSNIRSPLQQRSCAFELKTPKHQRMHLPLPRRFERTQSQQMCQMPILSSPCLSIISSHMIWLIWILVTSLRWKIKVVWPKLNSA